MSTRVVGGFPSRILLTILLITTVSTVSANEAEWKEYGHWLIRHIDEPPKHIFRSASYGKQVDTGSEAVIVVDRHDNQCRASYIHFLLALPAPVEIAIPGVQGEMLLTVDEWKTHTIGYSYKVAAGSATAEVTLAPYRNPERLLAELNKGEFLKVEFFLHEEVQSFGFSLYGSMDALYESYRQCQISELRRQMESLERQGK